ncbi:putative disease resistance RPP13-like protein 1 [Papaver somniferum]|uniref:putative disease resistance RPP13-like protein 1 n=1 Tax=Papaver somniferum TaxID=3469 RepID=UPI000E7014AF|nr:putative disease resistance RPP13-like protein 1 [Papaver somniferum]
MAHILTIGAAGIVNKLVDSVSREIGMTWGVKDDLKKLLNTLEMILSKIVDAELKQEKSNDLRLWLKSLKDIAYDVDDVMDSLSYEAMRRQHERDGLKNKVLDFVSSSNPLAFRLSMAKKLKDINKRLDVVAMEMGRFQLQTTPANTTMAHDDSSGQLSRQTTSSVDESETFEREDDKNEIVKILTMVNASSSSSSTSLMNPDRKNEKVAVISLVGVGGLGKTKLAQLVYNDKLVMKHFDLRMWVCVSEDFDLKALLVKLLESITQNMEFNNIPDVGVLAEKVREELAEKKYLLVLDNMWNEDAERWERLKSLLAVGAQGSKILINTRRIQVADVVKGSISPFKLKHLEEDECWSIIAKIAFSHGGALKTSKMTNIGREIAKRCGGLPLAAKFLGSLMHSKSEESDWLSIQENEIWNSPVCQNKIMPILRLSYDNLSSELKQCFSYCSLFPKDREINKEALIQLWMAEGYLDSSAQTNRSLEETGDEYFERLVGSSFLEGVKKNVLGDITTCKMHDLVHDLAVEVTGDGECMSLKVSELNNASEFRRLTLTMDEELSATLHETIGNIKKLRTLIVLEPMHTLNLDRFSRNKHLRVLHLGHLGVDCSDILYSTAKLRHLRYLNLLSINFAVATKIGESIVRFYNLQTLVLMGCIHVQDVLRRIECLKNLRYLDISCTDVKELPDSVTSLGNLRRLDLNHCISLTAFPSSVTGLQYLRFLDMSFTPIEELPSFISRLHNLQTLDLTNCSRLRALPEYVTSLKHLRIFNFSDCPLVKTLPKNFGALTQLRSLNLGGTGVQVIPESCVSLKNLEFLNLFFCELPEEVNHWTKLREFYYRKEGTPTGIGELVRLQILSYRVIKSVAGTSECYNGIEEIGKLNLLEELLIFDVENVKDPIHAGKANLQRKQNLRYLGLYYGENLLEDNCCSDSIMVLEALQPPTNLRNLKIVNFMGLDIPKWLSVPSNLPNLEQLELEYCKEIKHLPAVIGQFQRLRFFELTGMSFKSLDVDLPLVNEINLTDMLHLKEIRCCCPLLQNLKIVGSKSLIEFPSFPSLQQLYLEKTNHKLVSSISRNLTSLTKILLANIEELVYFPVSILQNNRNLQVLSFNGCKQFEGFRVNSGEDEIALFGALQRLVLMNCPALKFLPDLRRWNSLWKLSIFRCPLLRLTLTYDLKSLSFLKELYVDFIQRNEQHGAISDADDLINLLQ